MLINSKELIEMIEKEKSSFDDLRKCDFYDGIITGLNNVETYIKDKESKTKLTTLQHKILKKAKDDGFYWIAKDKNDSVFVYSNKPVRKERYFDFPENYDICQHIPSWLEPFNDIITWEKGVVKIDELLNNCNEVIDNK